MAAGSTTSADRRFEDEGASLTGAAHGIGETCAHVGSADEPAGARRSRPSDPILRA